MSPLRIVKNEFSLLKKLFPHPSIVKAQPLATSGVDSLKTLSDQERLLLRKTGITSQDLQEAVMNETAVSYDRAMVYRDVDRAREH